MTAPQLPLDYVCTPNIRVAWDLWSRLADELPDELAYTEDELELIMLRPVPPGWSGRRIAWRWSYPEWALVGGDIIVQRGLESSRTGRWEVQRAGCICCYKGLPHHSDIRGNKRITPGWQIARFGASVPGASVRAISHPWLRGSSSDVALVRPAVLPTPDEVRAWADGGLGEWHGPTAVVDPCQGVW